MSTIRDKTPELASTTRSSKVSRRVEMWRGGSGAAYLFPRFDKLTGHEPDVRISRIRRSDGRRLQAHATSASPEGQACSGIASSFFGGYRLAPLSRPLVPSQAWLKSGPFPICLRRLRRQAGAPLSGGILTHWRSAPFHGALDCHG